MEDWAGNGRSGNWSASHYVSEWLSYTSKIRNAIPTRMKPLFQAGNFRGFDGEEMDLEHNHWNAEFILRNGIDGTGEVKTIAQHEVCHESNSTEVSFFVTKDLTILSQFMGSDCPSNSEPISLARNLMNHTNVVRHLWPNAILASYAASRGVSYVLGETNTMSVCFFIV